MATDKLQRKMVYRKINNVIQDESTVKPGKWKVISRKIDDVIKDESTEKSGRLSLLVGAVSLPTGHCDESSVPPSFQR